MPKPRVLTHFSPSGQRMPVRLREFAERHGYEVVELAQAADVLDRVSRSFPAAVVLDGTHSGEASLELCRQMKSEAFTAVVPLIVYTHGGGADAAAAALEAGADEVLTPLVSERETDLRIALALRRADRDVSVHPTTRLPGTAHIERDFADRIAAGEPFAVCYADIDHFKEFNDRYGYHHGDRVIQIVSRILRDVVRAHASRGFVGHIGGDDFIFSIPLVHLKPCCEDILSIFDSLIPLQYDEEDRKKGFFVGHDRRGNPYEVPLMTLSIGVVTNEHREFSHPAEISELATEMKSYAKTFPGSVWKVDRRVGRADDGPEHE